MSIINHQHNLHICLIPSPNIVIGFDSNKFHEFGYYHMSRRIFNFSQNKTISNSLFRHCSRVFISFQNKTQRFHCMTLSSLSIYVVFVDHHQGNKDVTPFSFPTTKGYVEFIGREKARAYLQCIYCKVKQWICLHWNLERRTWELEASKIVSIKESIA